MNWLLFVLGAVLSWGMYGPMLHKGQVALGNPLRALLCVGVAYFLIGVLVPVLMLAAQGQLGGFNLAGSVDRDHRGRARRARRASASSWRSAPAGCRPIVMPLVFGGAPLVNVLVSMASTRRARRPHRCSTSASCSRPRALTWCCASSPVARRKGRPRERGHAPGYSH